MTLLGLPWVIGYLIIDTKRTLIFSYLFTIINSSQGTIVFIFHCLISKSVREELLKGLSRQTQRLFSSMDGNKRAGGVLGGYSSNSKSPVFLNGSKPLHRGSSNTSSFRSPKKNESAKLLNYKGSNCSSSQNSSINNHQNNRNTNKKPGHFESFFKYIYDLLFCFCLRSSASTSSASSFSTSLDMNNNNNIKNVSNNKTFSMSHSSSSSSSRVTSDPNDIDHSPFHNYTLNKQNFNGGVLSINEEDELSSHLLNNKCENYTIKPPIPPMYFNQSDNQSSLRSNGSSVMGNFLQLINSNHLPASMKRTNINNNLNHLLTPTASVNMKRTSSQMSSSSSNSNNPTQSTYISPIGVDLASSTIHRYHANMLNNSGQVPSVPPPLPPPLNYSNFYGVDIPVSNASQARNNLNDSTRFSTFKGKKNDQTNGQQRNFNSYNFNKLKQQYQHIAPNNQPTTNQINHTSNNNNMIKRGNYDENQYLTPEYHSYSMVDSEFQSDTQYYCDDGICGVALEDDVSNNYVEVVDEFLDEQNSSNISSNNHHQQNKLCLQTEIKNLKYLNNLNQLKTKSQQNSSMKFRNKLRDLITMPEEYDTENSNMDNSNISDQDLFNMTAAVNGGRAQNNQKLSNHDLFINKLPASSSSCSSTTTTSGHNNSSSIDSCSMKLNQQQQQPNLLLLSPDENLKAKKILQRL